MCYSLHNIATWLFITVVKKGLYSFIKIDFFDKANCSFIWLFRPRANKKNCYPDIF